MFKFAPFKILITFIVVAISSFAQAYYSTMDTGDILTKNHYRLTTEAQGILSDGNGANLIGRIDTAINSSSEFEVLIGTGKTDFQTGAFYKLIPFPDIDDQPAIGFKVGLLWARIDDATAISTRFHPIVSKKFTQQNGIFNVFASLPMGQTTYDGHGSTPVNFACGTEFTSTEYKNLRFSGELGIKLNDDSFNYISLGLVFYFDDQGGFELK